MKNKSTAPAIVKAPTIKFVRKAGMWCKTTWVNGEQKQEWFNEKPTL